MHTPTQSFEQIAEWGTAHLERVIAIDSQSDEQSPTIPSTEGQRRLSDHLRAFFEELGYASEQDESANLLVTVPSNVEHDAPAVALMVHMDTSEGTNAVARLERVPAWDGTRVNYPSNARLAVSVDGYPATRDFLGEDLLHGPGDAPVGLDDKLGMSELMTLARLLRENPQIPHGDLVLVFRPDEEIGRMEAVVGLAETLRGRGVRYGYTVDGIAPFEVNVENFHASRARVTIPAGELDLPAEPSRRVTVRIDGVKSHGATAKAEGYLNATLVFARATAQVGAGVIPVAFASDPACETSADATFLLRGADLDAAERRLAAALETELAPHAWRGAALTVTARQNTDGAGEPSGLAAAAEHLRRFLAAPGPLPKLSEDSEVRQGYSNPCFLCRADDGWTVDYRLRDFDREGLTAREEHVTGVATETGAAVEVAQQYVNMGPALADFPELVTWAVAALEPLSVEARTYPIRGGTGVDPFLERGIPVANVGTGYFAPESEKELTSRQSIARHSLWLSNLAQVIARAGGAS